MRVITSAKRFGVTVAVAWAAATASLICSALIALGPGVALARCAEVWLQRLLPGRVPAIATFDPHWQTEQFLVQSGHLWYNTPVLHADNYFSLAVFSAVVGTVAAFVHVGVCELLARGSARLSLQFRDLWANADTRASFCRRGAGALFVAVTFWIVLMFIWGGADRGTITQAKYGGTVLEIAYGPFGRFALLLAAIASYGLGLVFAARVAIARTKRQTTAPESPDIHAHPFRRTLALLAVAVVVLSTFPYWIMQIHRITGDDLAARVDRWSRTTVAHDILDNLAPIPQQPCAPMPQDSGH